MELATEGLKVVVFDKQQPGREASWAAAGMLSPAPDSPRDIPLVRLSVESLRLYPEFVSQVEEGAGISTGYLRNGALQIFQEPQGEPERDRMVAEQRALGLAAAAISLEAARERENSIGPMARAAAFLPDEATIEPRLLMSAVMTTAARRGVELRPGCEVTSLLLERERCEGVMASGKIAAEHVVLAAGCFSGEIGGHRGVIRRCAPTRPVRGQMLALRSTDCPLHGVLRSEQGYLVPRTEGLVVAGSTIENVGFNKQVTARGISQILAAATQLCPGLADAEIVESWSGLRPGTPDDLPILGPAEIERLLFATGHYRNGILLAPVTAKLVLNWITKGQAKFKTQAFSPLRFPASGEDNSRNALAT
jgi:glycine oxidase